MMVWAVSYRRTKLIDVSNNMLLLKRWRSFKLPIGNIVSLKETKEYAVSIDQMGLTGSMFTANFIVKTTNGKKFRIFGDVNISLYHEIKNIEKGLNQIPPNMKRLRD